MTGFGPEWLWKREGGFNLQLGSKEKLYKQLYTSIGTCGVWNPSRNNRHGGIFNLEFSPNGSVVVAACEKRSILALDPLTRKEITKLNDAHNDCVNCVKFIDNNIFATCSDDFTIALWDIRRLGNRIKCLQGHDNWVKNIEYSSKDKLLVSSGFDGSVLSWDINEDRQFERVFFTNGLMRTRLTPDSSKMIVCTTAGYMIVIHNLDLFNLQNDIGNFKPNMYRLMQISQTVLPSADDFSHLFKGHGKRNRVEFISDFPGEGDAEVISSLHVHPDGHSVISRNVTIDESSEWTCVHNIEERMCPDVSDMQDAEVYGDYEGPDEIACDAHWSHSNSVSVSPSYIIRGPLGNFDRHRISFSRYDIWEALITVQEIRTRSREQRIRMQQLRDEQMGWNEVRAEPVVENNNETDDQQVLDQVDNSEPQEPQSEMTVNASLPHRTNRHTALRYYRTRYRRSRVGRYDRTSINRRPSYRCLVTKRYKPNLSYNVTSSANNLPDNSAPSTSHSDVTSGTNPPVAVNSVHGERSNHSDASQVEAAPGSGIRTVEGHRSELHRRINESLSNRINNLMPLARSPVIRRGLLYSPLVRHTDDEHNDPNSVTLLTASTKINKKVYQNLSRLTHYCEEPNLGSGFIKELSVSADGRVICSPFGNGIRLLSYSPTLQDVMYSYPIRRPNSLYEISVIVEHSDIVVSSKFSPCHNLLVSGCLSGQIVFYQPYL